MVVLAQPGWYKSSPLDYMWKNVGIPDFSPSKVFFTSLAFSPSDEPYVAYGDNGILGGATVMKYDSVYVGIINHENEQLLIYPNPTVTDITIELKNNKNNLKHIEIYDIRGMIVLKTQLGKDKITFNVKDFNVGIYIVKLKTEIANYIGKFCKN